MDIPSLKTGQQLYGPLEGLRAKAFWSQRDYYGSAERKDKVQGECLLLLFINNKRFVRVY